MATPLLPWKFRSHTLIRGPRKPYYSQKKFLDFLHRTEISANLADFCLNSLAMATPFDPLKISIIYLNSPTAKTLLFTHKISEYFIQNWSLCNFGLFLPKFGCHSNALCFLKNTDSIFKFFRPESLMYVKIVTISRKELNSMHVFAFCVNLVAMTTPFGHLEFLWILRPRKHNYTRKLCLYILCRTAICAILVYFCLISVAMATPLAPSKVQVAYLNSITTPYALLYMWQISPFLAKNWIQCNFDFFAQIWLPWHLPWLPWNFI